MPKIWNPRLNDCVDAHHDRNFTDQTVIKQKSCWKLGFPIVNSIDGALAVNRVNRPSKVQLAEEPNGTLPVLAKHSWKNSKWQFLINTANSKEKKFYPWQNRIDDLECLNDWCLQSSVLISIYRHPVNTSGYYSIYHPFTWKSFWNFKLCLL